MSVLLGAFYPVSAQQKTTWATEPAARISLETGETLMLTGRFEEARREFEKAAAAGRSPSSERAQYLIASTLLLSDQMTAARSAFADYLLTYLDGAYVSEARLGIALSNERLGRTREAVEIYRAVAEQHPGSASRPWTLARLSQILSKSSPQESARYVALLRKEYPGYGGATYMSGGAVIPPAPPAAPPTTAPRLPARAPNETTAPREPIVQERPAAPTPETPRPAATVPDGRYFVQVGAFGVTENAKALVSKIEANGVSAEIEVRNNLNVVLAGPFATRADALTRVDELSLLAGGKVLVVEK